MSQFHYYNRMITLLYKTFSHINVYLKKTSLLRFYHKDNLSQNFNKIYDEACKCTTSSFNVLTRCLLGNITRNGKLSYVVVKLPRLRI